MVLDGNSEKMKALIGLMACVGCRSSDLTLDEVSGAVSCRNCGMRFKNVHGVTAFVPDELLSVSELSPAERETFLAMKKVAYAGDGFVSRMHNSYHRYAAAKRGELEGTRITVDVGFGIGEHYPFITAQEKSDASFIGIDLDRFKLEHFSADHPEIPVMQATALRLPFAASSVDVVQFLATLEHFPPGEIDGLLDEAVRILRPGGSLIACYPAEGGLLLRLCQKLMRFYLLKRTGFDLAQGEVHHHLSTAREIIGVFEKRVDLRRVEARYYPFAVACLDSSLFVNELYRKA